MATHNRPKAIILRQAHLLSLSHYKHNTLLKSETAWVQKWNSELTYDLSLTFQLYISCVKVILRSKVSLCKFYGPWARSFMNDIRGLQKSMDLTWSSGTTMYSYYRKPLTFLKPHKLKFKETLSKLQHVLQWITK